MGFLDKAKKLAEDAQQKLDEAQKQFNERQAAPGPGGAPAEYDAHGRPVHWLPAFADARPILERTLRAGDLCLVLGAGNVVELGRSLVAQRAS